MKFESSNPEFSPYLGLHGSRTALHPEAGPCFICEGRYLVEEALKAHHAGVLRVLSVLGSARILNELSPRLDPTIRPLEADGAELETLLGFAFHRGILACVAQPPEPAEAILIQARRLLVLPRLDNVDNLGQLLRTAAALGMDAVLVGQGPGPFERRTVRVSMGAAWRIPVFQREDLSALLSLWKSADPASEIVGAALREESLDSRTWSPAPRTALVLGPEDRGLDDAWLQRCDQVVRIPMANAMDSLNVAAAGAILMHRMI
jgi:tRNA G18 (ribose-2'-O)-methylase SpoU